MSKKGSERSDKIEKKIMSDKKWSTKCNGKIIRHGEKGYRIGKKGSKKWKSYCARSKGIMKKYNQDCNGKDKCSPNCLSRKKWDC